MSFQDGHTIDLQIKGPLLDKVWPLRDITEIFEDIHLIIDKAFTITYNMERGQVKDSVVIDIKNIHHSPFVATLQILLAGGQLAFGGTGIHTPLDVWILVKNGFDYLKTLLTLRASGKEPERIIQHNVNGMNLIGDKIIINNQTYIFGETTEKTFAHLVKKVDDTSITAISLLDAKQSGFALSSADRELFHPDTRVQKDTIKAQAEIYQFNRYHLTGKLKVVESTDIPLGNYSFSLIDKQNVPKYVYALVGDPISIMAFKEVEVRPSGHEKIAQLLVYGTDATL